MTRKESPFWRKRRARCGSSLPATPATEGTTAFSESQQSSCASSRPFLVAIVCPCNDWKADDKRRSGDYSLVNKNACGRFADIMHGGSDAGFRLTNRGRTAGESKPAAREPALPSERLLISAIACSVRSRRQVRRRGFHIWPFLAVRVRSRPAAGDVLGFGFYRATAAGVK